MDKDPKVTPFPVTEFPATRPKIGTAVAGLAVVVAFLVLYYWPMIRAYFGF
jgi:hypothetical protein